MIKRKAAMNRDQFLAKMHDYLTDSKATLLREIKAQLQTERDASRDDCMDSADLAAEQSEREIGTMLSERERFRVGQIDDAIERLVSQKYGLCERCGFEITEERLNAMPFARLCCNCQQERGVKRRRGTATRSSPTRAASSARSTRRRRETTICRSAQGMKGSSKCFRPNPGPRDYPLAVC